jgi:uncharacterized repeat protein (TIGR03843 family)
MDSDEEAGPADGLVDVVRPEEVETGGWLAVVEAQDDSGRPLVVVHADDPRLRSLAVLDAVLDNADRKAAHVGVAGGRLWGFDHGLSFNAEPKLRTVLWGWAGEDLGEEEVARLRRLLAELDGGGADGGGDGPAGDHGAGPLDELLAVPEVAALRLRLRALLADRRMPLPPAGRYPLPWPLW